MSIITRASGPPADASDDSEDGLRSRRLYGAVWRWHFYAGLFAIPVIVLLCLSGIVYAFVVVSTMGVYALIGVVEGLVTELSVWAFLTLRAELVPVTHG